MSKHIGWIVLIIGLIIMYQAGLFDNWIDYFKHSKQEQTIYNNDGSVSTVKYKTIFDLNKKE